jgi:HPt (histidine-containing phosphotransfer) domain-containing protein
MLQEQTDAKSKIFVRPPEALPYRVVVTYLDNCRNGLQPLKDAILRCDYDFVGVYSHRLKGSGGAYGFPALTEIGASIEAAARERNGHKLNSCAATLEAHLESLEVVET